MKRNILIGVGALLALGAVLFVALRMTAPVPLSQADADTFASANQLYGKGEYAGAAELYQQLIDSGVENGNVYYNLGKTYLALKQPGKADDAFARARALAPRDAEIAQTAPTSGIRIPLTANEVATMALAVVLLAAVAWLMVRPRLLWG